MNLTEGISGVFIGIEEKVGEALARLFLAVLLSPTSPPLGIFPHGCFPIQKVGTVRNPVLEQIMDGYTRRSKKTGAAAGDMPHNHSIGEH